MFNSEDPGRPVVIMSDCRTGGSASGKVGWLLGDLPLSITVRYPDNHFQALPFNEATMRRLESDGIVTIDSLHDQAAARLNHTLPMPALPAWYRAWLTPLWHQAIEDLEAEKSCWFFHLNPCIGIGSPLELEDIIWGCECYWRPLKPGEENTINAQAEDAEADAFAKVLGGMINALAEKMSAE
jgi:hypothetical protein